MQGAGNVSHNQAMDKATQEYHKFEVRTLSPVEQEYLRTIQLLNKKAKDKNREKPTNKFIVIRHLEKIFYLCQQINYFLILQIN